MKHIVVAFVRCQGITAGHHKLFRKVQSLCYQYDTKGFIYISKTVDNKKNPLSYNDRIYFASMLMPFRRHLICDDLEVRTIFDMMRKHSDKDATIHIVCGGDRLEEYEYKFNKYNNTDYNYKQIIVHNVGNRNSNVSGTTLREYVKNDEFDNFLTLLPRTATPFYALKLYNKLKASYENSG